MDTIIDSKLQSAETCIICTDSFSAKHCPASLPCQHIFGNDCIRKWLKDGEDLHGTCPICRHAVVEGRVQLNAPSLWKALSQQAPGHLYTLMTEMWPGLKILWKRDPTGKFNDVDVLKRAVMPALDRMLERAEDPDNETYKLIGDIRDFIMINWFGFFSENGAPEDIHGLAVPLVRLARLMSTASKTLPMWLTTHTRMNRLIWRANACVNLYEDFVSWDMIKAAAKLEDDRFFSLLHLYTVLISQSIAHNNTVKQEEWPTKRHEVMNLVVDRCITKICGGFWKGKPSNEFKDVLVKVYEELRNQQVHKKKLSLRGHAGEQHIVRGIWAMAKWT